MSLSGSVASTGSTGFPEGVVEPVKTAKTLENVRDWFARFICTVDESDLDLLTLWAAHTYLCKETYTSPRLILDSPVPGSGKTTTLEHLERVCAHPIQMASLSSPAMLTRLLDAGMRTVLIDEADRSLNPEKEGVSDLLAVLNSGYKRGGTRPVLVPSKGGDWTVSEMSTFSPVAMAGNNANLPEDTRSRSIRVLLMPDIEGKAEDSDWEMIEQEADALGQELQLWADSVRDFVRVTRPPVPEKVRGRAKERWMPLRRVAEAAGGRWPQLVDDLASQDVDRVNDEREEGIVQERPAVVLLRHIANVWGKSETFIATEELIDRLVKTYPEMWDTSSSFGKRLTAQRMGRMLVQSYNVHSDRPFADRKRGYLRSNVSRVARRFGIPLSNEPDEPDEPVEPDLQIAAPQPRVCPAPGCEAWLAGLEKQWGLCADHHREQVA